MPNERLYKKYRGSASLDSKLDRGESNNVEGNSKIIEYKGKVIRIISDIRDGLPSLPYVVRVMYWIFNRNVNSSESHQTEQSNEIHTYYQDEGNTDKITFI